MGKITSLITGSGVIGAYLSKELIKRNHNVIVTSRYLKKNYKNYKNYKYLKIHKKVKFIKLNILNKNNIKKILEKYLPTNVFYFSGQSSITKSFKLRKSTFESNYLGVKNFLDIINKINIKIKFFKANSGYIFLPKKGEISIKSKISKSLNPYIQSQIKAYKLVKKFRKKGLKCYNIIFLQVESPLRDNDFFVKKVCIHAKSKRIITVGNINTVRDYSWAPEIVKGVYCLSKINPCDIILSSGKGISGKDIIDFAYKKNNLNYKKYLNTNLNFFRRNEVKVLKGSKNNTKTLTNKFNWKSRIFGKKLVKKMLNSI